MATLCRAYPSEAIAREAIERLRAAGLPPQGAQLITAGSVHDLRREPVGEFRGLAAPDAPVGTFGNVTLRRWRPAGGFAGNPDRQREGSFADVDHHAVITRDPGGGQRRRDAGLQRLERLLQATGLEPDEAQRALAQVRAGNALVLVQIAEIGPADAARELEAAGRAA